MTNSLAGRKNVELQLAEKVGQLGVSNQNLKAAPESESVLPGAPNK